MYWNKNFWYSDCDRPIVLNGIYTNISMPWNVRVKNACDKSNKRRAEGVTEMTNKQRFLKNNFFYTQLAMFNERSLYLLDEWFRISRKRMFLTVTDILHKNLQIWNLMFVSERLQFAVRHHLLWRYLNIKKKCSSLIRWTSRTTDRCLPMKGHFVQRECINSFRWVLPQGYK